MKVEYRAFKTLSPNGVEDSALSEADGVFISAADYGRTVAEKLRTALNFNGLVLQSKSGKSWVVYRKAPQGVNIEPTGSIEIS